MGTLKIEILGTVRALRDGTEIAIGGPVDRAVLGLLAAHPGRRVAIGTLVDNAYPGIGRTSARKALYTAVWRLRRALGDDGDRLVTDRDGYRLDLEESAIDASVCRAALDAASGSACGADDVERLADALARWGGQPSEVPGAAGETLDELVCESVETLARHLARSGRRADAHHHLRRAVAAYPERTSTAELAASLQASEPADAPTSDVDARASLDAPVATVVTLATVLGAATMAELLTTVSLWAATNDDDAGRIFDSDADVVDAVHTGVQEGFLELSDPAAASGTVISLEPADSLLDALPASRVLAKHGVAAAALRRLYGAAPGPHTHRVARHLSAAVPVVAATEAVDALSAAGEFDLPEAPKVAVEQFERALSVLDEWAPADHDRRIQLLLSLGRSREAAGQASAATEAWEQAADVAHAHGLTSLEAEAALELAGTVWRPRYYPDAAERLDRAVASLTADDELRGLVVLRRMQLERFGTGGDPLVHARVASDRILLAGLRADDAAGHATVDLVRWAANIEEGTATFDDDPVIETAIASAGDVPMLQLLWGRWTVTRAIAQGRFSDAEAALSRLAARIPEWTENARTGVQLDELAQARQASAMQLATVRLYQGRMEDAFELSSAPDADRYEGVILDDRAVSALYRSRAGDLETARSLLSDVLDALWTRPADRFRYTTAVNAAFVAADLGDADPVRLLADDLEPWRGRHCVIGYAGYAGVTEHALGRLRAAQDRLDEADDLLGTAVEAHLQVGAVVFASLSRMFRAEVLQRLGGSHRVREAEDLRLEVERSHASFS